MMVDRDGMQKFTESKSLTCKRQRCTSLCHCLCCLVDDNTHIGPIVSTLRGVDEQAIVDQVGEPGRGSDCTAILPPDNGDGIGRCEGAVETGRTAWCNSHVGGGSCEN